MLKDSENVVLNVYKCDFASQSCWTCSKKISRHLCDKNQFVLNYMNKYQINFDSQIRISSLEYNISYKNRSRFFKKKNSIAQNYRYRNAFRLLCN